MKNQKVVTYVMFSMLFTFVYSVNAQKADSAKSGEMKTLINANLGLKSWGVSLSPFTQFGQPGRQTGLSALFHVNNTWAIGITGMGSMRMRDRYMYDEKPEQRFGGLHLEYTPKANALIHVSFPLVVGVISQEKWEPIFLPLPVNDPLQSGWPEPISHDHLGRRNENFDKSIGIQPGINLEVNLFKYAKLFGGVNYRFAFGKNSNSDIQGVSGQFGFKFGVFNTRLKK